MRPRNPASGLTPSARRHLSVEVLRQYVAGTLSSAEQHRVEAHTLDCVQCADILTGLEMQPAATTDQSLLELQQRLHARVAELATEHEPAAPVRMWRQLAAAAVLLLTLGAVAWFTLQHTSVPEVASARRPAIERLAIRVPRPVPTPSAAPAPAVTASRPVEVATSSVVPRRAAPSGKYQRRARPQYARVAPNVSPPDEAATASSVSASVAAASIAPAATISGVRPDSATATPQAYAIQSAPAEAATSKTVASRANNSSMSQRMAMATMPPTDSAGWRTIRGRITDRATGRSLPGATVVVPGTQYGTTTAADGAFQVKVPPTAQQVLISSIGYAAQTQPLPAPNAILALALAADTKALSEVVVVRREAAPAPMSVSAMPAGGYGSLKKYLKDSLDYPEKALEARTQGTVRLRFTVSEDGKVSEIKVVKKLSEECDAEAVRLIEQGPAWFPAIQNGRRTARQVEVSVPFKIEER